MPCQRWLLQEEGFSGPVGGMFDLRVLCSNPDRWGLP